MEALIILILSFGCTTFNVWCIHWLFHRRWLIKLYSNHLEHHSSNQEDRFLFSRISIPFLVLIILFTIFGIYTTVNGTIILISTILCTGLHDFMHYHFHKKNSYYNKYAWFQKLRRRHFDHHRNMNTNYGIIFFGWDKLFRTLLR